LSRAAFCRALERPIPYRGAVLALWRAAYEMHFLETRPGRIRKIRVKPTVPECWTASQLVEVVQAFRSLHGQLQSDPTLRRATLWTAFVLVGYYSPLRYVDLMLLRWDQIQDGLIVVPMSKTGVIIACALPADASDGNRSHLNQTPRTRTAPAEYISRKDSIVQQGFGMATRGRSASTRR